MRDSDVVDERSALSTILEWSMTQPMWTRDALRRLIQNGELTGRDEEELTEICLNPDTNSPAPLEDIHLPADTGEAVTLASIQNPNNINALPNDQLLSFASCGLTLVYGDNGSGKSGYVRVLKHACFARDRSPILPPIAHPNRGDQHALITYCRGAVSRDHQWTPQTTCEDLQAINVFDMKSANKQIEKTNDVAFVPFPMQILRELARTSVSITRNLKERISTLQAQTPLSIKSSLLDEKTAAGTYVKGLSEKSSVTNLDLLCDLSQEELVKLNSLERDLAQSPQQAADRLLEHQRRLSRYSKLIENHCSIGHADTFGRLKGLEESLAQKEESARIAADRLFSTSELPNIGGDIWRNLWEAARRYSDQHAYPKHVFPYEESNDDHLCVLCHQPLSNDALKRMSSFEEYVKSSTRAEAEDAKRQVDALWHNINENELSIQQIREACNFIQLEIGNSDLAKAVQKSAIIAKLRLRALRRKTEIPDLGPTFPKTDIDATETDLKDRASRLHAGESSSEFQMLVNEMAELRDRRKLCEIKDDVAAEITRKQEIARLNEAIKRARKRPITDKNKELSDILVTNTLRGTFAREVKQLSVETVPIELSKVKDNDATSFFRVSFVDQPQEDVSEVFSEGEHRCVALAAFMSELATSGNSSGIVFDDPYTSLDHLHRDFLASRLAEEAKVRQVVVFTHDLTFLWALRREAEKLPDVEVTYQTIKKKSNIPGHVFDEIPQNAKSTLQITSELKAELKKNKNLLINGKEMERRIFAKGFIEQLREVWDQGVADFIQPVLARFDNEVKSSSISKLAILTEEDVQAVTDARRRLSHELHHSSEALNPKTVTPDQLQQEISSVERWASSIKERQKML